MFVGICILRLGRVPRQRYALGEGIGCKLRSDSALMSKEFE